jgi:hypothetical protein
MSQHLIKEIQDLRHQVDSLRQEVRQEEEGLDTDKVMRQLWDMSQQLFKRVKALESAFYGDKQRREGDAPPPEDFGPDPRGGSGKITIGQNRKFT